MGTITIRKLSLRKISNKFEKREFAIPEIQRQYVWNKSRICNLLDSIYNQYPIGIFLVWEAPTVKAVHIRPNNRTLIPSFSTKNQMAEMLIDGQQRLSTLYGILKGLGPNNEANSSIDFRELFFNCNRKAAKRFVFSSRLNEDSKGYIRLTDLLNVSPAVLKRRLKLKNWEFQELKKCNIRFYSYKFFILSFNKVDFDDVREIFIRINSSGMTVSRADTLFARATDVNLRMHMEDARRALKHGFDKIPTDAMQNTLALAYGSRQIGGKGFEKFLHRIEEEKKGNREFYKMWKKLRYGYEEAVDFLVNHIKVRELSLLPTQNIFSMLSYFFFLNQSRCDPAQMREIRKWFWHTICGDRYSGARFNKNIPKDISFFKRLSKSGNPKYFVDERINPLDFLRTNYRGQGNSVSAGAYYLMLRMKKPKYLANGQEILLEETSSISNRKDRHHIFPSNLLKRRNVNPRWRDAIVNICFLESDENQSFGDNPPRKYLCDYKRKKHFGKVMRSHLIPYRASSPIWEKDVSLAFRKFVNLRAKMILREIEGLAGARIFEKLVPIARVK